jgi:hypothetical protein
MHHAGFLRAFTYVLDDKPLRLPIQGLQLCVPNFLVVIELQLNLWHIAKYKLAVLGNASAAAL